MTFSMHACKAMKGWYTCNTRRVSFAICYSPSGFLGSYTTLMSMTVCMVWNQRDICSCMPSLGKGSHWLNTIWLALISSSWIWLLLRSWTYSHIPLPRGMCSRLSPPVLSTQIMGLDIRVLYRAGAGSENKMLFIDIQAIKCCCCMFLFLWRYFRLKWEWYSEYNCFILHYMCSVPQHPGSSLASGASFGIWHVDTSRWGVPPMAKVKELKASILES